MGKAKKIPTEKSYNTESIAEVNHVDEPATAYQVSNLSATGRTINMIGMSGKKEYQAIQNDNDFINIIRAGIPRQAMTTLMDITDLSLLEMAAITHTSDRTLRRYKPQQKLSEGQSERILELAKLYSRGAEVFGSMDSFKNWMNTNLLPFANSKPKEYLDTSLGINMILDEIGRIENGIFA